MSEHPGLLFRVCREDKGMSLRACAKNIGVSAAFLSDAERGGRALSGTLCAYAGKHFGGNTDWWIWAQVMYDVAQFRERRMQELTKQSRHPRRGRTP